MPRRSQFAILLGLIFCAFLSLYGGFASLNQTTLQTTPRVIPDTTHYPVKRDPVEVLNIEDGRYYPHTTFFNSVPIGTIVSEGNGTPAERELMKREPLDSISFVRRNGPTEDDDIAFVPLRALGYAAYGYPYQTTSRPVLWNPHTNEVHLNGVKAPVPIYLKDGRAYIPHTRLGIFGFSVEIRRAIEGESALHYPTIGTVEIKSK